MSDEAIDKAGIFGRVDEVIATCMRDDRTPTALYFGANEWAQLCELCKEWDHDWPTTKPYPDRPDDRTRAAFKGLKIYRVDAESHLEAH